MNTVFGLPADTLMTVLLVALGLIFTVVLVSALRYPVPFRLGMRNLARRKSQTALIIGGLALSTLIITSALAIGDTVGYSVRSEVYKRLGAIDLQVGATRIEAASGFSLGSSGPANSASDTTWFAEAALQPIAALVGDAIDGVAPAAIARLPVANSNSKLSEAAVEIRGIGEITGAGLDLPVALSGLAEGEVAVNRALAAALDANLQDELLIIKGQPTTATIAAILPDGGLAGSDPAVLMPLARAQTLFGQPNQLTSVLVSNRGDAESGVASNDAALAELASVLPAGLVISPVKVDQIEAAATSAEFITTLFVTFGLFSIFSGILLIFLIFSVLAAERKSELGMSRAVGLQRADLVRQFVTEGLAYNFVAAFLGAALGTLAALLLARVVSNLLGAGNLDITPRVSMQSVVIGYSLGLVVTFITVSLSAIRISKINIIAAIRDLNLPVPKRLPQWSLFVHPFTVWRAALQKAGQGNYRAAARLFLFAAPKAILNFWAGLAARGPVMMGLGYLVAWAGVNAAGQSGVYGLGVSMFIIGLGQMAHWLGLKPRLAYSLTGLALILYWALPTRELGRLAELEGGPGDFFISGLFLVGGAIVVFLYNADSLLGLFAGILGRLGNLLPVARVAIAYPVATKGRTATTLAMFSLIIFTLVSVSTIANTFGNFLDVESGSGGYDILVQSNPFNPVPTEEFRARIDELTSAGEINRPAALAAALFAPIQAQAPGMVQPAAYAINGVDESFFATQQLELAALAKGYETPAQVWTALQADPTLVVIDNFSVDRSGDPTYQPDAEAFRIASISASDTTFEPTTISLAGSDGIGREFTVIGVLASAPSFFGATMSAEAAKSLGFEGANRYFVRLSAGSDAQASARAIESAFSQSGLQTTLLKEQLADSRRSIDGIFALVQGFIALGLLIGIAALGVITIRAVVERRQQIGVLRAVGFQRRMVQNVFLLESLFIVGMATLIGYGLALTFAYNLYLQVAADQGLPFLPPWPTLIAIGALILVASLFTAWLPARTTSKIVIAEALRYE